MSELAKCPFCGGNADYHETYSGDHRITCAFCGVKVYGDSEEDVAAKWNRKAAPECPKVEWKDTLEGLNSTAYVNGVKIGFLAHRTPHQIEWFGCWFSLPICDDMAAAKHAAETAVSEYWNSVHGVMK